MIELLRRLPVQLTLLRLVLAIPLWCFALLELRTPLGVGLAIAGLTDVLDGPIARRTGRVTRLGSQLDSVADNILYVSIVAWLFMLRPTFFREYAVPIGVWLAIATLSIVVGWVRFRRVGNLHLYSAKAAGVVNYVFAVYMLMFDGPAVPFFWVAMTFAFAGSAETLLVVLTRSHVDERARSLFGPS
jgi:phosphatidylglycerophosphate synthase